MADLALSGCPGRQWLAARSRSAWRSPPASAVTWQSPASGPSCPPRWRTSNVCMNSSRSSSTSSSRQAAARAAARPPRNPPWGRPARLRAQRQARRPPAATRWCRRWTGMQRAMIACSQRRRGQQVGWAGGRGRGAPSWETTGVSSGSGRAALAQHVAASARRCAQGCCGCCCPAAAADPRPRRAAGVEGGKRAAPLPGHVVPVTKQAPGASGGWPGLNPCLAASNALTTFTMSELGCSVCCLQRQPDPALASRPA